MRRPESTRVRGAAALAVVAVCAAVAVLVSTGTLTGGTPQTKLTAVQRLHNAVWRAAKLAAERAANFELTAEQHACHRGGRIGGKVPGERYSRAVKIAERYLGVPYVWGGASPSGFDSSGLVTYVYRKLGVSLPHYTVSQYCDSKAVHPSRSELQPGDLVFFAGRSHVGIYIGNDLFIHAPHTGTVVRIGSLTGWYARNYDGATRILS